MLLLSILAAILTGAAIYFGSEWLGAKSRHKSMTNIERANAQIEEDRASTKKADPMARFQKFLKTRGYEGDWIPIILVVSVLYMVSAVALKMIGIGTWVGAVLALPAAIVVCFAGLATAKRKQKKKFQMQLMQALGLIATQIEAGDGAKRAIEKTVGLVEEPLRGEFTNSLNSLIGTASLVTALKELQERYPSRAMRLFVAALEIDDRVGAKLAPALRQAQTSLEKDFELAAEANAEVSQARGEFFGITAVIGFIVVSLVGGSQGITREAYSSTIGMIILGICGVNYVWGILRTLKIFRLTQGSE